MLRSQWLASATALDDLLRQAVDTAGSWIDGLQDPEYGPAGDLFAETFSATGCEQELDPEFFTRACYNSHSVRQGDSGFHNNILYGSLAMRKLDALFCARVHESTHAMQSKKAAALHASPFNPNTKIIICPEDWLMLQERCEQGAYAMQAWFSTMLADQAAGDADDLVKKIAESSEKEPVSVSEFRQMRQRTGSLAQAMVEAARAAMKKNFYSDHGDYDYYKFENNYHDNALTGYSQVMNVRRDRGEKDFIFVRLGPKDREAMVRAIGEAFGPNCFGANGILPEFLEGVTLSDKVNSKIATQSPKDRLADLNQRLGIGDRDGLPELSDALAAQGKTLESFLAEAYSNVIHVKPRANTLTPS